MMFDSLILFMQNSSVSSFFVSLGASATWDLIKKYAKDHSKEKDVEFLLYKAISEALCVFYDMKGWEYYETAVMDAFLEHAPGLIDGKVINPSKEILKATTGMPIKDSDLNEWNNAIRMILSKDRYETLYRYISLKLPVPARDLSWLDETMADNWGKLDVKCDSNFNAIFDDIDTTLDSMKWNMTKSLVWEVLLNAQGHGKATISKLNITTDSITVIDNGGKYNPINLTKEANGKGGKDSLDMYKEEYPEVSFKYSHSDGNNRFTIYFNESAINVNRMSEIVVPSLWYRCVISTRHPKCEFKYYFVDIDSIRDKERLPITMSSLVTFTDQLAGYLHGNDEKRIYIKFTDLADVDIKYAYKGVVRALKRVDEKMQKQIVLIPEALESESIIESE